MPARRPQTPRTRDQLVSFDTITDEGKDRLLGELARVVADLGARVASLETRVSELESAP